MNVKYYSKSEAKHISYLEAINGTGILTQLSDVLQNLVATLEALNMHNVHKF